MQAPPMQGQPPMQMMAPPQMPGAPNMQHWASLINSVWIPRDVWVNYNSLMSSKFKRAKMLCDLPTIRLTLNCLQVSALVTYSHTPYHAQRKNWSDKSVKKLCSSGLLHLRFSSLKHSTRLLILIKLHRFLRQRQAALSTRKWSPTQTPRQLVRIWRERSPTNSSPTNKHRTEVNN